MKRRALYFTAAERAEIVEEPLPPLPADYVLVETELSAISAGTELLFYRGQVPPEMAVDESIDALAGRPVDFPLKYGYAAVGRVVEVGRDVDDTWRDRPVFAFNPHESHFLARPDALIPIPDGTPPSAAVFLPTMETAVALVMDARPVIGEQVAVFGLGMVGLLTTGLLGRMPLGRLVGVDRCARRRQAALGLGAAPALDPATPHAAARIRAALTGDGEYRGADLILELSGNPAALDQALEVAGFNGRVVVGSWYGTKPAMLTALGGRFHRGHVQIVSSQVTHLHPRWTGRWSKARRLDTAWDALASLDPEPLISHRLPLDRARAAYDLLARRPEETLQILLTY